MLMQQNEADLFLNKSRQERAISIKFSRNTLIAFAVSIIIHALLLWVVVPNFNAKPIQITQTLNVSLLPTPEPVTKAPEIAPVPPEPIPEKIKPLPKVMAKKPSTQPSKPKPQDFSVPKVLTQPAPSPNVLPDNTPKPPAPADAPQDMMALVKQNRARREATEANAAQQNAAAAAAERGPSDEEKRNQRIMQNLKIGTNGLFEIRRLEPNNASFSFKGWTDDANNAHMQYFEVEAKSNQDIRLVMVKRMIALIREHYDGEFTWESHRLGRSITMSAKLQDNAGLEDFLMKEFFGEKYNMQ